MPDPELPFCPSYSTIITVLCHHAVRYVLKKSTYTLVLSCKLVANDNGSFKRKEAHDNFPLIKDEPIPSDWVGCLILGTIWCLQQAPSNR